LTTGLRFEEKKGTLLPSKKTHGDYIRKGVFLINPPLKAKKAKREEKNGRLFITRGEKEERLQKTLL